LWGKKKSEMKIFVVASLKNDLVVHDDITKTTTTTTITTTKITVKVLSS